MTWKKPERPSGFSNPQKPTWTIRRRNVEVSVWFNEGGKPPYYRTKLSVTRYTAEENALPWERIQTLVTTTTNKDPGEDELCIAAILIREAHSWVESHKAAYIMSKAGRRQCAIDRHIRRKAKAEKAEKAEFEPIEH